MTEEQFAERVRIVSAWVAKVAKPNSLNSYPLAGHNGRYITLGEVEFPVAKMPLADGRKAKCLIRKEDGDNLYFYDGRSKLVKHPVAEVLSDDSILAEVACLIVAFNLASH